MLTFNLMVSSLVLHLHGSDFDGTISFLEFQCICECHALTFWVSFPKDPVGSTFLGEGI